MEGGETTSSSTSAVPVLEVVPYRYSTGALSRREIGDVRDGPTPIVRLRPAAPLSTHEY
jgi:hypothetical protein